MLMETSSGVDCRRRLLMLLRLVVIQIQQSYIVLQQVALWVVLEDSAGSGPLSLHVGDLLPSQAYVFLQEILDFAARAVRAIGDGMRLVEDSESVLFPLVGRWFVTMQRI